MNPTIICGESVYLPDELRNRYRYLVSKVSVVQNYDFEVIGFNSIKELTLIDLVVCTCNYADHGYTMLGIPVKERIYNDDRFSYLYHQSMIKYKDH